MAEKAKGPALAGGAALLGLAGGIALNRSKKRGLLDRVPTPSLKKPNLSMPKPNLSMPKPNLSMPKPNLNMPKVSRPNIKADDALKRVGEAAGTVAQRSRQLGDVATQVQRASDAINNGKG